MLHIYEKKRYWIILLAYLTVVGITIDLRIPDTDVHPVFQLLKSAGSFSLERLFLLVGLCAFYAYAFRDINKDRWMLWDKICVVIPAVLFAGFMVVGYSFVHTNSLELILTTRLQIAKTLIAFTGYGIGFVISIAWFYTRLTDLRIFHISKGEGSKTSSKKGIIGQYKTLLMKYPFQTVILTLFIVYIPYMVLSYPAIMMGDSKSYILQGFNLYEDTSGYLRLIDENVKLNGHHPVIYTMYVHVCLIVGKSVFGSYNIGIFLVAFSQLLGVCVALAIAMRILTKMGVDENILLGLISYFAFAPRMQNYMFIISKDVFAACVLLLYMLSVFCMMQDGSSPKGTLFRISLFGIATALIRNEGKYIILGSIVVMLFLVKEHRKKLMVSGVMIAVSLGLFFNVLMPALHITPSSRREALSVPFQQTARYFRDCSEDVTEKEWEAVAAVLDASSIGEIYNPTKSDPVKRTFNEAATSEELITYFKAWFQMGLKHPLVYVQATINNYYNYFYPGERLADGYSYNDSKYYMESINKNENLKRIGCSFYYPKVLDSIRTTYETLREQIFELPVLSLLKSSAAYVWILVLLVFYCLKERTSKGLVLTIPPVLSVGVCILGPCNGEYFRYLYSVSLCLPIIFFQCLYMCKCLREPNYEKLRMN